MKKILVLTLSGLATGVALMAATPAIAGGVNWSVNIGAGGYPYPPPVYYQEPPRYYAPPVIYRAPVYEVAQPVVVYGAPYGYAYERRYWHRHHGPRYGRGYREYRDYRR